MRRVSAIILILTLCFNSVGYYGLHLVLKNRIRQEIKIKIKQQVPADELVKIEYTSNNKNDFQWIHSREFRYKGTMYDVVSREHVSENMEILHCVTDHQETQLFKELDNYVQNSMNSDPGTRQASSFFNQLLSGLYLPVKTSLFQETSIVTKKWYHFVSHYSQPHLAKLSPPPKAV